jgi:hypothetical protein
MFCQDYELSQNSDKTKKTIGTIRPEFISGTNATLSRSTDGLVLVWKDHYPEKQNQALKSLFDKLNLEMSQGLPFWGNLKLKFEIAPPRTEQLRNKLKRMAVEF